MILKKNQSLVDFVAQYSGTVDELFTVAVGNGIGITDEVAPGTALVVAAVELRVTKYFAGSLLDVCTNETIPATLGGIGYMQMGTNFIII